MGSSWSSSSAVPTVPSGHEEVTVDEVAHLVDGSRYIRPYRMRFTHNGRARAWDLLKGHDAVAVLLHNTTSDTIVLVYQFRPAVYYHRSLGCQDASIPPTAGYTLEVRKGHPMLPLYALVCIHSVSPPPQLPAGLVDKADKSLKQIAAEECLEEAGYQVDPASLAEINTVYGGVGLKAGVLVMYYTAVTDADKVEGAGGGLAEEGEFLSVVHMPVAQAASLLKQDDIPLPTGLGYALEWFMARREAEKQHSQLLAVGVVAALGGAVTALAAAGKLDPRKW